MLRDPSLEERVADLRLRERQAELRACLTAVRAAEGGAGSVVIVRGPAGAGKTRLLAAAAGVARSVGTRARHASGVELEQELPFGVALDLLGASASDVAGADQLVVVRRLFEQLAAEARSTSLALFVDDLHWIDDATLRLLAYLARRIESLPIALVVGTRPLSTARAPGPADELLQTPGAVVLEPAPLSREAIADVLGEHLTAPPEADLVAACAEATGGNPLLVLELARVIHAEGLSGATEIREVGPQAVAWSTRMTLRGMGDDALALAQALAVLEATDDVEVLLELAGVAAGPARAALGELEHAEVVTADGPLRLAHPLVRRALLEDLPETTLGLMRRSAARLLHERDRNAAAAAQLLLAPPGSADWAVDALVAAASQASGRAAPAEAGHLLARALEEPAPEHLRGSLLTLLARARSAAGDPEAPATFEAAIETAPDADARAALLLSLAWAHQERGRFAEAVAASRRGLNEDPQDERVVTQLAAMHDAAVVWSPADRPGDGGAVAARRVDAADAQAARVALADEARRRTFAGEGGSEAAVELALRAWDGGALLAASTADDPALIRVILALHCSDRLADARTVIDACLADAIDRGLPLAELTWIHYRGHIRLAQGEIAECIADLSRVLAGTSSGWGAWLPVSAGALVTAHLERGEFDAAGAALVTARGAGTHPAESPAWTIAEAAEGRLALARGETSVAVRLLAEAGRRATAEMAAVNPALGAWRADLVRALRQMRRVDEARRHAETELAAARRWGSPGALSQALRTAGAVDDDGGSRLRLLDEAVGLVAPSEARLEHAHAVLALGAELRRSGDDRARARLQEAIELAEACGATGLASVAQRQLVAAGGRLRRRPRSGRDALTPGERRVAQLAATGLSNRDIADELVVTPKAVAFHLGNAYRKLGIGGRRDLPADL